jgi:hypothetical protein
LSLILSSTNLQVALISFELAFVLQLLTCGLFPIVCSVVSGAVPFMMVMRRIIWWPCKGLGLKEIWNESEEEWRQCYRARSLGYGKLDEVKEEEEEEMMGKLTPRFDIAVVVWMHPIADEPPTSGASCG